jgi:3',5'-cyclic AMP phosphodiesterase CpdA
MYPAMLRKSVLWPALGNHETYSFEDPMPYLTIFTLPTAGEAGGVPSGTENYYSFAYGNIHFVCLDSMTQDRGSDGPMAAWLEQDLAANTNNWLIAFWHHPPYTKGSHNSDDPFGFDFELVEMRENIVPILESYGVDLILCGHSHCYERSYLLNGHYGYSSEIATNLQLIRDSRSGRMNETGPYVKPAASTNQGAVYVVAGSSGQRSGGPLDHPAMFLSLNRLGSLVLDIDGDRLDARFLEDTGIVSDYFTILKGDEFRITSLNIDANLLTVTWRADPGETYYIDFKAALTDANWTPVSGGIIAQGTQASWTGLRPPDATAFYRVVKLEHQEPQ